MSSAEELYCASGLGNWSAAEHTLLFLKVDRTLSVSVDGTVVGSLTQAAEVDSSLFEAAPLRFGGNHVDPTGQNLRMRFSSVAIFGAAMFR